MITKNKTIQQVTLFTVLSFLTPFAVAEEKTAPVNETTIQEQQPTADKPKSSFSSVEERRLYTMLQSERENLEEEKKVLALKEKELKTLEKEADKKLKLLDDKLDQLKKVQRKIEGLLAEKDVEEVKKIKDLSLIYAKMSPDRAALAMGSIDPQLAADLLANMKVKSAAKILDKMDKVKASQLSTTFTTIQVE